MFVSSSGVLVNSLPFGSATQVDDVSTTRQSLCNSGYVRIVDCTIADCTAVDQPTLSASSDSETDDEDWDRHDP